MLFNLFKKKEPGVNFTDKIYISAAAKKQAIAELAKKEPAYIFIAWFADTLKEYRQLFIENGLDESRILDAKTIHSAKINQHKPVFLEHYPLHSKETALVITWEAKDFPVYNSLDEPIFLQFGGDRITELIKKMGMTENEEISHPFITKALRNAQEKLAKKVTLELSASSQAEWFEKNIRP